jgi:hypothetical protein
MLLVTLQRTLLMTCSFTVGSPSAPGWSTTSTVTLLLWILARSAAVLMAWQQQQQQQCEGRASNDVMILHQSTPQDHLCLLLEQQLLAW